MTAIADVVIRSASRTDLPAIVAMLADDPLGQTRERPDLPLDPRYLQAFDDIIADPAQSLMVATVADEVVVACSSPSSPDFRAWAPNAP